MNYLQSMYEGGTGMARERRCVERIRQRLKTGLATVMIVGLVFGMEQGSALAAAVEIDCDQLAPINGAIGNLKPGDTLVVSGMCVEKIVIPRHMHNITLDGQGKATIQAPKPSKPGPPVFPVFIEGTNITIKGFTIEGGYHGIHLSGPASAVIDGNIIQHADVGIHIDKGSLGMIINNTIKKNHHMGIHVNENSYARIGFLIPPRPKPLPNVVSNNGGNAIVVDRSSSAWIVGNIIKENKGHGVLVDRNSQVDVVANTIAANTGDGIHARHNSGVNLSDEGSERNDGPNITLKDSINAGFGIRCGVDGYVAGPQGSLAGTKGAKHFENACTDNVVE